MRCDVAKATGLAGRVAGREPTQRGHRVGETGLVWTRCGLLRALPGSWLVGHSLTSPEGPAGRRFRLDTRLRRIRRKDWRRDFFRDFTRDSGPSKASWSLGCSVHLGAGGARTTHPVIRAARAQG